MKRRNKYSHNGCTRCKTSSVKCDEARPVCSNCRRKGLSCEYKSNVFVYQPGDKTKNKRRPFRKVDGIKKFPETSLLQYPDTELPASTISVENNSFEIIDEVIDQMRIDFNSRTSKPVSEIKQKTLGCDVMNKLAAERILEVPDYVHSWRLYNKDKFLKLDRKLDGKGVNNRGGHFHESDPEVQELLYYCFIESKCVYNFVLVIDDNHNCVCDWFLFFAKKYSIISYTVNAITSNALDISCSDDRWSCILERSMSTTLLNISKRVGECDSFPELACYLICIMFLFSERSASRLDAWRLHLKGAFAIVEKCDSLYSKISLNLNDNDYEMKLATGMYAWTKNWFVASETIACLSAPKGGAIEDINISRQYLRYESVLKRNSLHDFHNGFLVGGFNLMKGYSQNLTPVFAGIIEYILSYKASMGISLSGSEGILQNVTVSGLESTLSDQLLNTVLKVEKEKFDFTGIRDYQKRATMKACNICYCYALRIFIYAVMLGKSIYGPEIQECVQIIEEQLTTIHNIAVYGLCIHWPLFVAALCSQHSYQRKTLISAIRDIANNGTFVARNTQERLEKCWKIIDCGGVINEEDYDCTTM